MRSERARPAAPPPPPRPSAVLPPGLAPLALLVLLCAAPARAEPVPEHDLKAAFVFNFAVFTAWPAQALPGAAPIVVCASPGGALFGALGKLNDKTVNGHRVAVLGTPPGAAGCHLLVLERGERERSAQSRAELAAAHVLTVSDRAPGPGDGAVIGLWSENARIGFDVDLGAARAAGLVLSSKLLRLARSAQ
ncbi:MAG: YfiR family protein [Pseudomonadota bacterium]